MEISAFSSKFRGKFVKRSYILDFIQKKEVTDFNHIKEHNITELLVPDHHLQLAIKICLDKNFEFLHHQVGSLQTF